MTLSHDHRCGNCRNTFSLYDDDLQFYRRVGIAPPTLCRHCRVQRRMAWRNDRSFYHRSCDLSGKPMISLYPAGTTFPVYHPSAWYGDGWDALDYAQEIDFTRPFFAQWRELMNKVPRLGIDIVNCENSDYCNYCGDDKNCYLDIAGEANEDCYYNLFTKYSKNCVDCTFVYESQWCYEAINCYRCYELQHSMYAEDSHECAFSFDLKGCSNCLFCNNLRQKQYHIDNKSYSKSEYAALRAALALETSAGLYDAVRRWKKIVIPRARHRDMYTLNCENCSGNEIKNSKNCTQAYNVSDCEDCKYLYDVLQAKDCYDLNYSLYQPELCCELISTLGMKYSAFAMASHYCSEVFYCDQCNNSSALFGCIGLNRKKHCILNRQYSAQEYAKLRDKLIAHMRTTGEWGQFFPANIAPFGYNETVAQEYYPLSEESARGQGFGWSNREEASIPARSGVVIPERSAEAAEGFTREVLLCETSKKPYKVILPELRFYQRLSLPLPRRAPAQRHAERLALRNPRRLWQRVCSRCNSQIRTSYPPQCNYEICCQSCYEREC